MNNPQPTSVKRVIAGVAVSVSALALAAPPAAAQPAGFETTMMDQIGTVPALGASTAPAVNRTAQLVAFQSRGTNLVIGDTNDARDIFVRHRTDGHIVRVSVSGNGTQANRDSELPSIDSNGSNVAYASFASNLVAGDTDNTNDVFVHSIPFGTTTLVSRGSDGTRGNGASGDPAISGNGRFVAFTSVANNLVPGDTNGANDIFVADRISGQLSRVSVRADGGQTDGGSFHPAISFDGRYVAFSSRATNFVSNDTNAAQDVFVHDRQTGTIKRVSVHSNGRQADRDSVNPSITTSGEAYVVAFDSAATTLVGNDTNGVRDVYVFTSQPQRTVRASLDSAGGQGDQASSRPSISADARYVAFSSQAANLVTGDTNNAADVFRRDLETGQTRRFSVATGGGQGSGPVADGAFEPAIDAAGRRVTYSSDFANLVPGDNLLGSNIFQTVDNAEPARQQ